MNKKKNLYINSPSKQTVKEQLYKSKNTTEYVNKIMKLSVKEYSDARKLPDETAVGSHPPHTDLNKYSGSCHLNAFTTSLFIVF